MEETSKHGVLGRHQSCSEERIEFLSDTIERNHPLRHAPSLWYKVVRMETGEVVFEKVYASPRPPPKISLKHDWMKELGSEVVQQPEGEVVQQSKCSQSSQPNPIQIVIERRNSLFALKEEHPVHRKSKHVLSVKNLGNM